MDLTRPELLDVGLDVLEADGVPTDLRARVLDAASARPVAHAAWAAGDDGRAALDALTSTAADLGGLLQHLAGDEWDRPTELQGASVRDVVLHLVGVERYLLGQLARRPAIDAPRAEDHFPVLRAAAAADLVDASDAQISRSWWLEVMALIGAFAEVGPDHSIAYHHLAGSVRGTAVVRTFEIWTHDDDIRRALGFPPNELDHDRLALMSRTLLGALGLGMALRGTERPGRSARIELTGSGGGTSFEIGLSPGAPAGGPDVTIETSALDLCRLASNRLPVDRIPVLVAGDRSLVEPVLVGATAFALD
jgi:uncharacterized protein (TIGR03083 family)